jgi:hypothetical protein
MPWKRQTPDRVKVVDGTWVEVAEYRGTDHGFDVILGWPEGKKKGRAGGGRSQVILTVPLARYLEMFRMKPGRMDLSLGCSAIRKLRERLGHHIREDIRRWWEERRDDLAHLSGYAFAVKHGKTASGVHYTHRVLFGKRHRTPNWWKVPDVRAIFRCGKSAGRITGPRIKPKFRWKAPDAQEILLSDMPWWRSLIS